MEPLLKAAFREAEARGFNSAIDAANEVIGSASTTVDATAARRQLFDLPIGGPYGRPTVIRASERSSAESGLGEGGKHGEGGFDEQIEQLIAEAKAD